MVFICGLGLLFFLENYQNHHMGLQLFLELSPGTPILKCLLRFLDKGAWWPGGRDLYSGARYGVFDSH